MRRSIKITLLLLCLFFAIHEIIIIIEGLIDDDQFKTRVVVILGSKANVDGSLSNRLQARLDSGLDLYKNGKVQELYVSGGLGKEGFYFYNPRVFRFL